MKKSMKKFLLASIFLASGVLATSTSALAAKPFTDLGSNTTHSKAVKHLNSLNAYDYKTGKQLKGNTVVTRGEASKLLFNLQNKKLKKVRTYKNNFKDIGKNKFSKEIIWGYEVGIFDANNAKKFNPTSAMTKAQMATTLVKTFKLKKGKKASSFKDVKSSHSAFKDISILASNGVVVKDNKGNYQPNNKVTLNQLSSSIYSIMKLKKNTSTTVAKKPAVGPGKDFKTLGDLKRIAKTLYNDPAYEPKRVTVYTSTDLFDKFIDYYGMTLDFSQDAPGYTFYGRLVNIYSEKQSTGVYKTTINITNDREKDEERAWKKGMDRAEKYIKANYKLETDYDVVFAINDFVIKTLEYGEWPEDDNPYVTMRPGVSTCTGYTDFVSELHKRFGLESRLASGDVHAWNIVKVGGKWYHTDSTFNDGSKTKTDYLLMTESERAQSVSQIDTKFKATNVKFDPSMALPYKVK